MVLIQELDIGYRKEEQRETDIGISRTHYCCLEHRNISSYFYLWGEYIRAISDLIEFGCSQNSDVSVGPPAQIQFLAVSYGKDTRRYSYNYCTHTHAYNKGKCARLPSLT